MEKLDSVAVTLVLKMKEIVITIIIVKMVFFADQTIVQRHLVLTLKLIVVIQINVLVAVRILLGKAMALVMMETTIVDVNGMEETVVVIMLTQLGVQLVNV